MFQARAQNQAGPEVPPANVCMIPLGPERDSYYQAILTYYQFIERLWLRTEKVPTIVVQEHKSNMVIETVIIYFLLFIKTG